LVRWIKAIPERLSHPRTSASIRVPLREIEAEYETPRLCGDRHSHEAWLLITRGNVRGTLPTDPTRPSCHRPGRALPRVPTAARPAKAAAAAAAVAGNGGVWRASPGGGEWRGKIAPTVYPDAPARACLHHAPRCRAEPLSRVWINDTAHPAAGCGGRGRLHSGSGRRMLEAALRFENSVELHADFAHSALDKTQAAGGERFQQRHRTVGRGIVRLRVGAARQILEPGAR
jgi:hypothetical protein